MLLPDFTVSQPECNQLVLRDVTPSYSVDYPGGYGAVNIDANQIVWAKIGLDMGGNGYYELEKVYNQTLGDWVINAGDIPLEQPAAASGCEECQGFEQAQTDCHGFMSAFPEGCITLRYEVFSFEQACNCIKAEGTRVKQIVSTCQQDQKFVALADKLTLGDDCHYDFQMSSEKKAKIMQEFILAWTKLKLMAGTQTGCDCECVAIRIKQIGAYLDSVKL
ncbi:hypothetical protein [Dyadobacter sp. BHUBP1]|uniref:hypothetical protein n=1 Tax=Dyadobacter sp. BHUBP1 TaxID=3424178 RepID=UPI003D33764A